MADLMMASIWNNNNQEKLRINGFEVYVCIAVFGTGGVGTLYGLEHEEKINYNKLNKCNICVDILLCFANTRIIQY